MGELIELAESLRWALCKAAKLRWKTGEPIGAEEEEAWCRLYRAEESIREFEREMAREI